MLLCRSTVALMIGLGFASRVAAARGQDPACEFAEVAELLPLDRAAEDRLGSPNAVAICGNTLVIGSAVHQHSGCGGSVGAAYIYAHTGTSWGYEAELAACGCPMNNGFGVAVACDGNTVVVGSNVGGEVYVFEKGAGWIDGCGNLTATLQPSIASSSFGDHVATFGDTVVVGASADDGNRGAAFVFKKGAGWVTGSTNQAAKLTACNPAPFDHFGNDVAIWNDTVVVGATAEGAAYVFDGSGGWADGCTNKVGRLLPIGDGTFGYPVSISGNTVVVGSNGTGSAYVFEPGAGWQDGTANQVAELTALDSARATCFGHHGVDISGDTVVVGAYCENNNTGAAYIYCKPPGGWQDMTESQRITASDGDTGDDFGRVAIDGNTILSGASGHDHGPTNAGAAYVFSHCDATACDDGNPCTDDTCVGGVCSNTPNNNPCNDFDACTTNDACSGGSCVGGPPLDCDDGDPCTVDSCHLVSGCQHDPVDCDDGVDCTDDSCDTVTGCQYVNNSDPCDDGIFCNGVDTCANGSCSSHSGDPCASGDACNRFCNEGPGDGTGDCFNPAGTGCGNSANTDCTDPDTCDGAGACLQNDAPQGTDCGDPTNSDCTNPDTCDGDGSCLDNHAPPGTACGDATDDECTNPDSCDSSGTCVPNHLPNGTPCSDGLFCNGDDACMNGACAQHSGDPCPNDHSDSDCAGTCREETSDCSGPEPDGSPCDDTLFCTATDACSGGQCFGSGDPCVPDECDEDFDGCVCVSGGPCDDNDACTVDDTCVGGICRGQDVVCPPGGGECNEASCDPNGPDSNCDGRTPINEGGQCDDADGCTENDTCHGGVCEGTVVPSCIHCEDDDQCKPGHVCDLSIEICVPLGACCDRDIASCVDDMTEAECAPDEWTAEVTCSDLDPPCANEACCLPNGGCSGLGRQACLDSGGVPKGNGTQCDDVSCLGACCLNDGTCAENESVECVSLGGVPLAPGTQCQDDLDNDGVDDICKAPCCLPSGFCFGSERVTACVADGGTIVDACLGDNDGNGTDDACQGDDCTTDNDECIGPGIDVDPCTFDWCMPDGCTHEDGRRGDVCGVGGLCGPDRNVNLNDILCILDGFSGMSDIHRGCAPGNFDIAGNQGSCVPNGVIDLSDIIGVLDAFQGLDMCCPGGR